SSRSIPSGCWNAPAPAWRPSPERPRRRLHPVWRRHASVYTQIMSSQAAPLRFALAQLNSTVGDIGGNAEAIAARVAEAREGGAQVVVFPELALTGDPPEDL